MPKRQENRDSSLDSRLSKVPSGDTMNTAMEISDSSQQAESRGLVPSLDDNLADSEPKSFPFMRLPIEIRTLVYNELLIQPETVAIYPHRTWHDGSKRAVTTPACRRRWVDSNGDVHDTSVSQQIFRQLSLTSRGAYRESTPIYFTYNTFEFEDLECVPGFLGQLSPNSRRAIVSLKLFYVGKAPAAAFKMLATCVGLRRLELVLHGYQTISLMQSSNRCVMKLYGLGDCLKLRGLTHIDVHRDHEHDDNHKWLNEYFADLPRFREALQVLKQPHDPARLARLDKKDYPSRLHRSVFGKANVTTRMENQVMGTTPQYY